MANKIDTRNRGKALLEILRARVQNSGWSLYSICCSPSGCCPPREAIAPQGTAVGVDMSQPFRLLVIAEPYRHDVSLKGSDKYCLWHRHWQMTTATHTEPERLGQIYPATSS